MRIGFSILAAALMLLVAGGDTFAARDPAANPGSGKELLVFEVEGCTYCAVFRRDVLARYQRSPLNTEAPLRFVDLNKTSEERYALNGRIAMVPTAVLMSEGREVDRLAGYWGPDNFFKLMAGLLARAD
jgi:thioredoxin-related protein